MKNTILSAISNGLQIVSTQNTIQNLGNRKSYVGMSDIAKMIECPRAAVANKLFNNSNAYNDIEHALMLSRGHWFEEGITAAFASQNFNLLTQLEIEITHESTPIQAHLDFVLIFPAQRPKIVVIELKSCENIPENLYPGYEMQLYGQIGLLKAAYSKPAFNFSFDKYLDFSKLAQKYLGFDLPNDSSQVDIEGYVLCLSMSKVKILGPYLPNKSMLNLCFDQANKLWSYVQNFIVDNLESIPHSKSFNPLCGYCAWNADCPKFKGTDNSSLGDELEYLTSLKEKRKQLEERISLIEDELKQIYTNSGENAWLNAENYRFKVSHQAGRKSLRQDQLFLELTNMIGETQAINILANCEHEGKGFNKLTINKINKINRKE